MITHSDSLPLLLLLVLVDGYEEKCESLFVPALLSLSLSFCEGIFTSSSTAAAANADGGSHRLQASTPPTYVSSDDDFSSRRLEAA